MPLLNTTIEPKTFRPSSIQLECRLNGKSTTSTMVIGQEITSNEPKLPHITLAESKVWLALGEIWLATNDLEAALTCAKTGLEELGDEYAPFLVEDDTDLKLFLAEGRIEKGYLNEAAELMLRALETRILLYAELHQENI